MDWLGTADHVLAREVLQRGVAAIYLIAFLSTLAQFPVLAGERGLSPIAVRLASRAFRGRPTLFAWRYSDRLLRVVAVTGMIVAALVVAGVPQTGPWWAPALCFLALYGLYLSVAEIGGTFWAFGWESLLVEAGFSVAFLGSSSTAVPIPSLCVVVWLVFRVEFGAGMIKLRGDRSWRDLTALTYHHETQPMPGPLSRSAHGAPRWWHRVEGVGNWVAQLGLPFLLVAPQPIATIAAALVVGSQLWLVVTGNFAWLNWLTIVLAVAAVSDGAVHAVVPALPAAGGATEVPISFGVVALAAAALVAALSWPAAANLLSRRQLMNASFNRARIAGAYGAFGSVTTERREVVIEGSALDEPAEDDWREYGFRGKPGDVGRIPRQVAPYHLRLDWQMWFLALGSPDRAWFRTLLGRLAEADRATLRLLAHDPFDGRPPALLRARVYDYRFTTRAEHRATGDVWVRRPLGTLVPATRAERLAARPRP